MILLIRFLQMSSVWCPPTLNSNLILLILWSNMKTVVAGVALNSNLILLIQAEHAVLAACYGSFKFQSDSINTRLCAECFKVCTGLNSNLILLIPPATLFLFWAGLTLNSNLILLMLQHQESSGILMWPLNSNLILLIPVRIGNKSLNFTASFKFQSDSINTALWFGCVSEWESFKFQSDSINTKKERTYYSCTACFKFQSDSINTAMG